MQLLTRWLAKIGVCALPSLLQCVLLLPQTPYRALPRALAPGRGGTLGGPSV